LMYQRVVEPRLEEDGYECLYKIYGLGEDGLGYRYFTGPQKVGATKGKMFTGVPLNKREEIKNGGAIKLVTITNFHDFSPDFGNIRSEGGIPFNSGKKPIKMIKHLLNYHKSKDITVLDFFSGSGSTAHAVMKLNTEDGGKRKFIMVQLPEKIEETDLYYKEGFRTICDLGEERLRRSGRLLKSESGIFVNDLDVGFRVLKLDSSNMNDVYYNPNQLNQNMLDQLVGNVKEDRTPLDLLFQVMLELGIELSSKIEEKALLGKKYFVVNENDIVACFDDGINDELVKELANIHSIYAVFKDSAFASDSANINCEQIFKSISPSTTIKVV